MPKSWRRKASLITAALVVGGLAVDVVATADAATPEAQVTRAAARPTPKLSCPTSSPARLLSITITTPRPNATVDLAAHPEFEIGGTFRGGFARFARRVELYADDQSIGAAQISRKAARDGSRSWSLQTSALPGKHTVLACVRTWSGHTAAAKVTITVKAPAPGATVISPDVVTPPAKVLNSITKLTTLGSIDVGVVVGASGGGAVAGQACDGADGFG